MMDAVLSPADEIQVIEIVESPTPPKRPSRPRGKLKWMKLLALLVAAMPAVPVAAYVTASAINTFRRERCVEHLKVVGAAFSAYLADKDHFPAPAITRADGAPLLSWRVALLPYLGYQSLYDRFHLDEPWDSPHNAALLGEMPEEFVCPTLTDRRSGRTGYLVVVGPKSDMGTVNTAFEPGRGLDIREFTDGTSQSALVFETDALVPWTKPEDLSWAQGAPPPPTPFVHTEVANVLFADGSVRPIRPVTAFDIRRAILTINGSEILSSS
jgi:prepilin-type processing-associated H-X9-DG protein